MMVMMMLMIMMVGTINDDEGGDGKAQMKGLVTPMRSSPKLRARYKVRLRSHFVGHSPSGAWPIGDTDQTFGIDAAGNGDDDNNDITTGCNG